jgi:hypothetical protein
VATGNGEQKVEAASFRGVVLIDEGKALKLHAAKGGRNLNTRETGQVVEPQVMEDAPQ